MIDYIVTDSDNNVLNPEEIDIRQSDILKECLITDSGMLFESKETSGLVLSLMDANGNQKIVTIISKTPMKISVSE